MLLRGQKRLIKTSSLTANMETSVPKETLICAGDAAPPTSASSFSQMRDVKICEAHMMEACVAAAAEAAAEATTAVARAVVKAAAATGRILTSY